jgi:hypothetical protein
MPSAFSPASILWCPRARFILSAVPKSVKYPTSVSAVPLVAGAAASRPEGSGYTRTTSPGVWRPLLAGSSQRILIGGASLIVLATLWFTQIGVSSHYAPAIVVPMILLSAGVGSSFLPLSITVLVHEGPYCRPAAYQR